MNKNCFRVIFSKTLQCLVVTSELAKTEGKSTERSSSRFPQLFAKIQPLTFSLFCALGFVSFSSTVSANLIIQADKSAPKNQQPIVLQTANGLPQVNIQTPNEQGLSHNKYSKFDVDTKGAILNNSRTNVQTQQGGWVQGNPYLARGEAKVILNEVNSSDPSVLKGYVEVAGKKADVIIANPSGIHCEGCGVINSDRSTLTTGKPQIQHGNLESFVVEKGKVSVSGKGLDNSRVDYTEIIARETQINAGVWSKKEMKVVTGKNTVKRTDKPEDLQIIHTQQAAVQESQPQVAIDVGQLGGMYAGKIHLIGTEQGVGVHNAGHIGANAETLKIDSQGRIVNSGTLNANKAVQLSGTKGVENRGKIENRRGDITLSSKADIKQDGSIVARAGNIHKTANREITQQGESIAKGDIRYNAPNVTASTRSLIAAGVEVKDTAEGEIRLLENRSAQGKTIAIKSSANVTLQGRNLTSGKIDVEGANVNLDKSHTSAYSINVNSAQGTIEVNDALLIAQRDLTLKTPTTLQTQNSYLKADKISTQQRSLNTKNATWEQTGTSAFSINTADKLQNQGGTFKTQGDFSVNAQGIDNRQGRFIANGKLTIDAGKNKVDSTGGALVSTQALSLTSGELINDDGLIQSQQSIRLNTQGQRLSNQQTLTDSQDKGIVALRELDIHSADLGNQQGRIVSGGNQQVKATEIDNTQGLIYSQHNLILSAKNLTNDRSEISSIKQADITLSGNLNQKNSSIRAQRLNLVTNTLNSTVQSLIFSDDLNITTLGELSNQDSRIITKINGNIETGNSLNNVNGTLGSQQSSLTINTHNHSLVNKKGNIIASKNITIESGEIDNHRGLVSASHIALNTNNQTINNQDTLFTNRDKGIIAQNTLILSTGLLNNTNGNILSYDHSTIDTNSLVNHYGEIRTQSRLDLNTNKLTQNAGLITSNIANLVSHNIQSNQQSEISGSLINVTAQILDNKDSKLIARQTANITVQHGIQNQNGILASLGKNLLINSYQSELNNRGGIIAAQNGSLQLEANTLDNQQGTVRAHTANISTLQSVDNSNTLADETQGIIATDLNLNAKQLNNQEGRITSFNQATFNSIDIQNQSGEILLVKDGMLNSDKINNKSGKIASTTANLGITTQTVLNNQLGSISAADQLAINTKGLSNQQGNISSSNQLKVNTTQKMLNNQGGSIFANNQVEIQSGEINNQQGLIRADNKLFINAHKNMIDNRNTQDKNQGIVGLGNVVLQGVNTLLNQQGKLYAEDLLNIDVKTNTNNSQGMMQSNGLLTLSTEKLDNQEGKITAKNVGRVTAYRINNRAVSEKGSLISAESLTLNVQELDNQETKAKDKIPTQGIQGNNMTIQTASLNNRQGGIYSANNVSITANNRFDNQKGELLAVNTVNVLNNGNLMVNNENGLIQGNKTVNLNAKGLESEGNIRTKGSLNITLKDSFTLNNAFEANDLAFKTEGDFTNNIEQIIANTMVISANNIVNNVNAELSANTTTLNSNSLTNRGVVDGVKTLINSTKVTNIGTGRIYGNHLAFRANTIDNLAETIEEETKAGTIAARERLDFGVDKLTNRDHALILSLGDMAIGGELDPNGYAFGKAGFIDNGSAKIEVLGDSVVNTSKLLNHDLYLKLGINTITEDVEEIALESKPTERYRVGVDGYYNWSGRTAWFAFYDKNKPTISEKQFYVWRYKQITHTPYIEKQDKAKFNIGGNLYLNGDDLQNKYSQIAIGKQLFLGDKVFSSNVGNLSLSANNTTLKNEDIEKVIKIDEKGDFFLLQHYKKHGNNGHRHAFISKHNPPTHVINSSFNTVLNTIGTPISSNATVDDKSKVKDIQLDKVLINTPKVELLGNITSPQVKLGDSKQHTEISLTPKINSNEVVNSGQVVAKLHTVLDKVDSFDLSDMTMPMVKTHLPDVRLPQASLYKINPDSPNGYLVETDPKFVNRKQWLSSDYMFNALRYNHDNVHKRLGDGFYEQRLINEQINQLTGSRYIEGYSNDLEQYKSLMNSGVKYAKQFNLAVGVGLTAKQMSELTTDMVWLVNKEITLADGRKMTALVPQVYLVARNSDITSQGAVISANQIIGNVNELNNNGVIAGRDITRIQSDQLENRGTILGDNVDLSATQNLVNLGGKIEAVKSLSFYAGKNLEIASTISSSQSADGNFARAALDQLSSVKVTGEGGRLALRSDGNLTVKAAQIESQGLLNATAGNALTITTLNTQNKKYYNGSADNYYRLNQKAEVGSSLTGKNGITLLSQNDINLRQADISSENGKTTIGSAQGNVTIKEGRAEEQLATSIKSTSRGLFSKTTSISRHEHHTNNAVGSNVDGQSVSVFAHKGNVTVQGSNTVAENDLRIQAKNIDIKEAENSVYSEDFYSKKKSGLLGGGSIGISFGSQKQTTEADQTKYYAGGSQVGSLKGNTTLIAEHHYNQSASAVSSVKGDVNILAEQVNIQAADDKYESNYKQTFEQKGLTLAITSPILSALQAVQSAVKSGEKVGNSKNDRVNAMAAANAGMDVYRAGQAVGQAGKALQDAMGEGGVDSVVGVQITYGQQKSVNQTHTAGKTAATSQVNAGGKVNIVATGAGKDSNIHIKGSDISGKGGTNLAADNDISITAAEQSHKERSTNKSSGFNAGVAIKVSNGVAAGVTLGGNYGKGYGNGDESTYVASHVGDANSQTTINAGGDANIIGSQIKGKRVNLNAENLNIESLQDTATYKGKQMNVGGSVTVGVGVAVGGSFNRSKINADHAGVNEQAGIYAGDEGYDINVNKHTDLKGAIITSTQQAEEEGKNRFTTGSLGYSDIENHSNYSGSSFGLSGRVAMNVDTPFGQGGNPQSSKQATDENGNLLYTDKQGNTTVNATGADGSVNKAKPAEGLASLQADYGMGYGSDKDSQSSVTKSGINTKNLIIKDEVEQQRRTGKTVVETIEAIKTDLTTDNAQAQSGKLTNHFDKDNVQKELDLQREVTESFGKTVTETGTLIADKLSEDARKKKYEAAVELEQAQNALNENNNEINRTLLLQAKAGFDKANQEAQAWETGGSQRRMLDSALNVLSTALAGRPATEVIASGLSPTVNQQIKEATTDKNGNVNAALNLTAHALWGAVEAYAGKHNVAAGVAGAVTGEVAAGIISQILYDKSPDKLSQEEKVTVSTLSQVAAGLVGGTLANSSDGTMIAAKTAKEAVEHNSLADDIHPSVEREQNIAMYAKVYFKGDEDKAREFIEGQEIAEARGQIDSVKDLAQAISNPLETAKSLWDVVSNPSETYDQILISEAQWRDAYENALENDPKLAGEMSGHLRGSLKGIPTGGVLLTGSGVAMAKSIAKVSDVIKSGKLNLARRAIPNSEVGIQWGKGISNQGKPWEAYVQSKLPEGAINLNDIKPNFKTFDHILPDGTAISSKTMDTIGSKTYQKPSKITYTLNKYVDEMVNFTRDGREPLVILNSDIKSRELYLAIPAKTTKEQMKAINKSIDYARSKGTNIIVNKVN